jgi:hypothetical protein
MAAAVSAARAGARVLLVEQQGFLGGMSTGAALGVFCGLYSSGPAPQPLSTGFGWQVVADLVAHDACYRGELGPTYLVHYDPDALKLAYDEAARAAGVRVMSHATLVDTASEGRRIVTAELTTPGGSTTVTARSWVDASGDAVLCHRAGASLEHRDKDSAQPATLVFRMAGVDIACPLLPRAELNDLMHRDAVSGRFELPRTSGSLYATSHPGEVVLNMTRVSVDAVDAFDLARAEAVARRQVREYARWLVERVPGFQHAFVSMVANLGIRESRRLRGRTVMDATWLRSGRRTGADLGYGAWPMESHDPRGSGTRIEWLDDDTVYGVPSGAALPAELDNVWVVGRCLSADPEAHASTRVMGTCFSVGEGAGAVAATRAVDGLAPDAAVADALRAVEGWRAAAIGPELLARRTRSWSSE